MRRFVSILLTVFMLGGLLSFFPACSVETFTVRFNTNGGEGDIPRQYVVKGAYCPEPDAATHATKIFTGWYREAEAVNKWDFSKDKVMSDITLYAGWAERSSDYEESMTWSKPDHLYFHYYRFKNERSDYEEWNMWVWPQLGEGVTFEWVDYDESGAIVAIDLTQVYEGGKTGVDVDYLQHEKNPESTEKDGLGFLIVLKESKSKTEGMWVSDGSANTYIDNFRDHKRSDGSVHVFINEMHVRNYRFSYITEEVYDNPYEGLEPGEAESVGGVDSSAQNTFNVAATSAEFLNNVGVGYTIFVPSFADSNGDGIGDLNGITQSLNYLKDLGAKVLWLTPIQESESYHGYDIVDYFKIDPRFGTMEDYRKLLFEAHARGIKVLMDLVPNHSSSNNVWFKKSSMLDPEYRSYYNWKYGDEYKDKDFWYQYSDTGYYFYAKFASSMPEFNFDYQGTRDAFVEVAKYWMSFGLDGFRLDAVKHIYMEDEYDPATRGANDVIVLDTDNTDPDKPVKYDHNVTKNVNFFKEFNARLKAVYPNAFLVGENFSGDPAKTAPYYEGMDSQFNFNLYYNLSQTSLVYNKDAGNYAVRYASTQLEAYANYRTNPIDSPMTSNHDVARLVNKAIAGAVTTASDPKLKVDDSNKADAVQKAELIAATILTLPGVSWIYYGDELGMSGYKIPITINGKDNFDHADRYFRQPFKWADSKAVDSRVTGFAFDEKYTIEWDDYNKTLPSLQAQMESATSTYSVYKMFANLKSDEVMTRGSYIPNALTGDSGEQENIFSFKRVYNGKTYYIYHNYSNRQFSGFHNAGGNVLASTRGASLNNNVTLPAYSSIVIG